MAPMPVLWGPAPPRCRGGQQVERELRALLPAPYTCLSDDMVRAGRLNSSESDHTFSRVQV